MGSCLRYLLVIFIITSTFSLMLGSESDKIYDLRADISSKITGNTSFCLGAPNAAITFEGEGGQPPYTFTYQVDGGTQTAVTTSGNSSSVQVSVNTIVAKSFTYKIVKIKDSSSQEKDQDVSRTVTVNTLPTGDFTFTNNQCSGTQVKFTPLTTGNYSYNWDFGDKTNSSEVSPTHAFKAIGNSSQNFDVTLTIKDETTQCQNTSTKTITVKQGPDATLNGSGSGTIYDGVPVFRSCSNNTSEFTFTNGSTTSNKKYKINWGDGTPDFESNTWSSTKHTYQVGLWNLIYTIEGSNGCSTEMEYIVFVGSNPAVSLGNPGNTDICISESLTFPITGTENNPPGTTYTVTFNDDSPAQIFNHPPPVSITHKFLKTSCGTMSSDGSKEYPNSFYAKIVAENPCFVSAVSVVPINISTPPETDFSVPSVCINTNACFTNTTTGAFEVNSQTCNKTPKFIWTISPITGVTLVNGNYGNDFGSNDPGLWQSGSETICLKFSNEGTYNITIKAANKCGESIKTKQITVTPLPAGTISGGATVCKDATQPEITFTGTSGTAPFMFTYKINNGANQTIKTTSGNSVKLPVSTSTPGIFKYTLVSVQDGNGCSQAQSGDATIEVKSAPTATITGSSNTCQHAPYPVITFTGNGGTPPYTFSYNIDNGPGKTVSTTNGNTVTVEVPTENLGTFKYNLTGVTDASANACTSPQTGSATITVNQSPGPLTLIDYEYCSGETASQIIFNNTVAGTTYSWTNSDSSIGLQSGGSGNIPPFAAKNNTANPVVSTVTVTPKANGCAGTSETFKIKVNPSASVIFTPGNQTVCSGENTQVVQLSSSTANATFSWTTTQPSGITGVITSGTDHIPVQTLTNSTNTPIDVIYKAKATVPGATSCAGTEYLYTITVNPNPVIKEIFSRSTCSKIPFIIDPANGGSNIVPAGTTYTWGMPVINPAGAITGASEQKVPQSSISQTLVNSTASTATATYTVTPVFNGCAGNTFIINVEVVPDASVNQANDVFLCNEEQSPLIEFTGSPAGTIFKWTSDNPGIGMPSKGTNSIAPFMAVNTGTSPAKATITVIPEKDQCEGTPMHFSITVNPTGQVVNPGLQNLCNGQNATINLTTVNTGGTTTYLWTNNNPAIGLGNSGNGNISFIPVNTGKTEIKATISVTPEYSANGISCMGDPVQFTVSVNPSPTVNQPPGQTLCNGVLTSEVLFTGDIPGTVYNWSNNNSSIGLAPNGQGDIPAFVAKNNTLNPVTATITVTPLVNGCSGPARNLTITVNPAGIITKQPVSSEVCLGEVPAQLSVDFTNGTGPPSYQWYSNKTNSYTGEIMIPGATQPSFNPPYSQADTIYYYCIISFPSGTCKILVSDIARVAINALPVISVLNTEINSGETFMVTPGLLNGDIVPPGTTYMWDEPVVNPAGSVTGMSAQTMPQTSISQTLTSSATGTATVTYNITPVSGLCTGAKFQVIVKVQPPIYTTTKVTPVTCYGDNDAIIEVFVSGGVSPYQIDWSNMGTGNIQTDLSPGIYTITITDAVGVQKTISETIQEAGLFTIDPVVKQISCHGADDGSIALNFQGGEPPVILNWSDNSTAGSTRNNLGPGNYSVKITDNKGCQINESFTITEPLPILVSAFVTNSLGCSEQNKGAIDLTVSGGVTPYNYSWSNGSVTEDLTNIPAGNYTIKVTDSMGCSNTAQYTVTRPGAIEITVTTAIKYDCTTQKVSEICTAVIKGGVPPHQIAWSTGTVSGANNEIMETDQSGLVVLKVTDDLGCIASQSFNTNIPVLGIQHQLINCDQHSYGFNAIIGDESQKINYLWDFGDGTTSDLRNPVHDFSHDGWYPVSLTTTNATTACVSRYELPLQVDARPTVGIDKTPKLCEGDTLTINATGADNYKWITGSENDSEDFSKTGNYYVIGYANTGCSDTAYFDISFFSPYGYEIFSDKQEITNEQNTVHFWTNDIPFSQYEWDFDDGIIAFGPDNFHRFEKLRDGYFDVSLDVINPDGCPEKDSIKILVTIESIANTFTPNSDGINDLYMVGWYKKIYNRNGILLYEGKDGWDGTYKGKPVANDTYFVIIYDSFESGSQYRTSYVTVIR